VSQVRFHRTQGSNMIWGASERLRQDLGGNEVDHRFASVTITMPTRLAQALHIAALVPRLGHKLLGCCSCSPPSPPALTVVESRRRRPVHEEFSAASAAALNSGDRAWRRPVSSPAAVPGTAGWTAQPFCQSHVCPGPRLRAWCNGTPARRWLQRPPPAQQEAEALSIERMAEDGWSWLPS